MPSSAHAGPALAATLRSIGLRSERGGRLVLDGTSVSVGPGDRIGVVGPNGVGKTTLLRLLAELDQPDGGTIEISPPWATVGYLAQDRQRPAGEDVAGFLRRQTGLDVAEVDLDAAVQSLATGDMSGPVQDAYERALDRFNQLSPGDFDERAAKAMTELGTGPELLASPLAVLSGGELARVGLAAVMLSRFDITLLDEPTNDLDFDGLARLEQFVLGLAGGALIVSHDRAFLSRTVNGVIELDEHTRQATYYGGTWESYLQERSTEARHKEEAYDKYSQRRDELLGRAQRERQWATSGASRERKAPKDNDKAQRDFRINRTEQLAARARRTDQALERMDQVEKPWEPWQLQYTLTSAPRAGAVVASLAHAVVKRGLFTLGPVDLVVGWGDRLAVTGRNGSGKTTLVDALVGRAPLSAGQQALGPSVVIGELGQEREGVMYHEGLGAGAEVLALFLSETGLGVSEARSLLAKFGLGADHVGRPLATLSPGERTRAQLACFQAVGVNFLVLDEPTNHLDMPAIEQLEAALGQYQGTLLIVSHDRRMLETLTLTHTARVENGQVQVEGA